MFPFSYQETAFSHQDSMWKLKRKYSSFLVSAVTGRPERLWTGHGLLILPEISGPPLLLTRPGPGACVTGVIITKNGAKGSYSLRPSDLASIILPARHPAGGRSWITLRISGKVHALRVPCPTACACEADLMCHNQVLRTQQGTLLFVHFANAIFSPR